MKTVIEVVDSLESIQDEATEVAQAAASSTSENTMTVTIDHDEEDFHLDSFVQGVDGGDDGEQSELKDAEVSRGNGRRKRTFAFDERFDELAKFKDRFGHCNIPKRYADNPRLGQWCHNMRQACNMHQKGQKPARDISGDRIERLEKIGFTIKSTSRDIMLDMRFNELATFKSKFGHCNVPSRYDGNHALGRWCCEMRYAYNQLQKRKKSRSPLSEDVIERLETIGFKWIASKETLFDKRFGELTEFKSKHGHCNVPYNCHENNSLGRWCNSMRNAHVQLQQGQKPFRHISGDIIERLDKIGFRWKDASL